MTQTGYTNAIVNAMLGWLRGLANWVLKLFNLSGGGSPLAFLARNWKGILLVLLIVGVALDLIIWLVRWRPHWVWFHKKRVVINDKDFFKRGELSETRRSSSPNARPKRDWEDNEYIVQSGVRRRREEKKRAVDLEPKRIQPKPEPEQKDVFRDQVFNVNAKQRFSDKYEDEVFNVSNLPGAKAGGHKPEARRK